MAMRKWGAETLVNTTTDNGQTAPVVTALQNGGYVVAWTDDMGAGQSVVKFQIYTAGGIKLGTEKTLPVSDGDGDQDQPTITTTANGNFIIGVRDFDSATDHDTMAYEFTPNAPNPGQQVRVTTLNSSGTADTGAPAVASVGSSTLHVYRSSNGDVLLQTLTATGTVGVAENVLYTTSATTSFTVPTDLIAIASNGDRSMVITANNGVLFTGTELTFKTIRPDFTGGIRDTESDARIDSISAAALAGQIPFSDVAYAYSITNGTIHVGKRAFDFPDDFAESFIDQATKPNVVALNDGMFAVTYRSLLDTSPATIDAIKIQLFDVNCVKIGSAVTINTTGLDSSTNPAVDMLADGRLIVTWAETSGLDGSGSGIFQQIIDPRDGIVNGSSNPLLAEILYGNDTYNDEINAYAGNDTIYGLAGSDAIHGGDGNDFIFGGRGDDTMYGGEGGDNLTGGAGADEFHGGNGTDVANYNDAKLGIVVALDGSVGSQGDAVDDTFIGVENVSGSRFDDTIIGNVENNSLFGGKGNDILRGLDGNDGLRGGEGGDTMAGGAGNDTFFFNSQIEANGSDVIVDFSSSAALNNDRVALTGAAFGLTAASFTAANFQSGTSATALAPDIRVFYETDTGILRYDADGNSAGAAIVLATLTGAPTLVFSDVVIL